MNTWYTNDTGNHQGLIIDENNGDNIAVTYDKKDAEPIVVLHNSTEELLEVLSYFGWGILENKDAQIHLEHIRWAKGLFYRLENLEKGEENDSN